MKTPHFIYYHDFITKQIIVANIRTNKATRYQRSTRGNIYPINSLFTSSHWAMREKQHCEITRIPRAVARTMIKSKIPG